MNLTEVKRELLKFGSRKETGMSEIILKLLDGNGNVSDVNISGDESCIIINSEFKDGSFRCFIVDPEGVKIEC